MKITQSDRRRVINFYLEQLATACVNHDCWPGNILNIKRKPAAVAAARSDIIAAMREHVGMRSGPEGRTVMEVFSKGLPEGWRPISTPVLGEITGQDHSTIVLAMQRRARLEVVDDEDGDSGP